MSRDRRDTQPFTPIPQRTGVTTDDMAAFREMARDEAASLDDKHELRCVNEGPVCKVWEEIDKMRTRMNGMELEQGKLLAVLGFWKWALPVAVTVASIGASLLSTYLRARHGG